MAEGLKIQVEADVKPALKGLRELDQQANETFKRTGSVFAPAASKAATSLTKFTQSSNSATQATINLGRVVQDAPYGFLGIANNLNPLLESFQRLKVETGSSKVALKQLGASLTGAGGVGLAISLVSSLAIVFGDRLLGAGKAAKEAKSSTDALRESIKGVFSGAGKEATEVISLVAVLSAETETRERKLSAIKQLQEIQPEVFKNIRLEKNEVIGLDESYKNYLTNLRTVIAAKIVQAKLEQLITKQLTLQGAANTQSQQTMLDGIKAIQDFRIAQAKKDGGAAGASVISKIFGDRKKIQDELSKVQSDIDAAFKELIEFSKGVTVKDPKGNVPKSVKEFFAKHPPIESPIPMEFTIDFKRLQFILLGGELKTFAERVEDFINKNIKELVVSPRIILSPEAQANQDNLERIRKFAADTAKSFNDALQTGLTQGLSGFGEGIGKVLTGGGIGDAFKAFFSAIGSAVQAMGEQIIALGIAAILAKRALETLFSNPFVAVAAGVALVAVGAALKNMLSGGIQGFAKGGIVSGPTLALIGEGAGTSRSNPEVVAPLDQLRSMLSDLGGGGTQRVFVTGRLRGNDMLLQNARTSRTQRRTTGR